MAVSVVPTTSNEHLALVKTTAPKYLKGASDLTFRRRLWLAMLKRYGMIEANATSHSCTWDVENSQPEVRQYGDSGDLEFNEHDAFEQLTVDVRGYTATDRITEKQRLMNGGQTQIVDLYKTKTERLVKRIRQVLCAELYIDGNAAGNSNRFLGIESFLGDDGLTVAGDRIANPSDTYAGKSTALGNAGGTWSNTTGAEEYNATLANDFPFGQGDIEYDYLAPLLVNYSSTAWNSGSTAWVDNCEEVIRFAGDALTHRGAKSDDQSVPTMHMLSSDLYNQFKNFYSARNRQIVPHKESTDLGFTRTMNFEGDGIHHEYDATAGTGYVICPNMMELFHAGPQLINSVGPEWAIEKMGYLYLCYVFGNVRFQSRYHGKYAAYA